MAFQPTDDAKAIAASNLVQAVATARAEQWRDLDTGRMENVLADWYVRALRIVDAESVTPTYHD